MPLYRLLAPTGSIPLAGGELKIGSSPDCQVRAEGPDVASHHARLVVRKGLMPLVIPCSASCQVFVDGHEVAGQAELKPGATLRVGTSEFHLELSSDAAPADAPRGPLWKRLVRWALYSAAAFILLIVLIIALIPVILSEARVKQKLEDVLEEKLQRDVNIDAVELDLLHGLKIRGLEVKNKEGFNTDQPFLQISEVDVRVEVWPFLTSRFGRLSGSVTVRDPKVYLERDARDGTFNTIGMFEGRKPAATGGSDGKDAGKAAAGRDPKEAAGAPLGPITNLNFRLAVENGSITFEDHRAKASGRLDGITVSAAVTDFDVPELRGSVSYDLSLASPQGAHPGRLQVRGATDLDLAAAPGRNALGMDIEKLSGELVNVNVQDLDLGELARFLDRPAPGAVSLQLVVKPVASRPLTMGINGKLDIPQIDAVALGLGSQQVPGAGAALAVDGQVELETGSAALTLDGTSALWKKLGARLQVRELPALALVAGQRSGSAPAGAVQFDFQATADIATLTGRDFGKLFGAKAPIAGTFSLSIKADGPVGDLPVSTELALKGITVPPEYTDGKPLPAEDLGLSVASRLALDPATLAFRRVSAEATITSAAVTGKLTNGLYAAAASGAPLQLGGEIAFKASFRKVLDRYQQILPALPPLDEELSLTASARSDKGPIALRAELESRQAGAKPDPIKLTAEARLGSGAELSFEDLVLTAKTPESKALDFRAAGQVLRASSAAPELSLQFGCPQTDLSALKARLEPILRLAGERAGRLDVRGQMTLSGGEIKGSPAGKMTVKLTLDLAGLEVSGLGADAKQGVKDSRMRLDLNADLEPAKRSLTARTVSLTSSICNLNLAGEVRDWGKLLGEYKFSLDADAEKTAALLGALGLIDPGLAPRGKASIALSADTRDGTISLERFLIDTDLVTVQISPGQLKGFQVEKIGDDPSKFAQAFDGLSGELVLEKCLMDVAALGKLRDTVPAIPRELSGAGPISLTARASGTKGRILLTVGLDADKAAVNFTGLINKPAGVAARVALDGQLQFDAESRPLRISKLEARLGELLVTGSGSAAMDMTQVDVALNVPKFAPESVRAMFPPLAEFAFGGKIELSGLKLAGNVKEVLDSKADIFAGRLAGLTFGGKAGLEDLSFECSQLPNMRLRASGPVEVDTAAVKLDGLSAGIVHKRTQQEARLTVVAGQVTSAVKDGRLLTDLGKLCISRLDVVCPEAKVHEILLAMEAPPAPAKPKAPSPAPPAAAPAAPAPRPAQPPAGKAPAAAKPYDFLAGYVIKDSTIRVGRVSYLNYVLTDLTGTLALKDNVANVTDFKAKAYKGDVSGRVSADLNVPNIAHTVDLRPTGVDVNAAATEIMAYKDIFHGRVSGSVTWAGVGYKPGEFASLDGRVQVRYDEPVVRNIEKFPPLREAVKSFGGDLFLPEFLKAINATEFKFVPTELTLALEAIDGKPVIRAKDKTMLRTVEADPLEVGLLGGIWLFPDAKGEFPFMDNTRMYVQRLPGRWLDQMNVDGLVPKGARTDKTAKALRDALQDELKAGKAFLTFAGTVQNPQVDNSGFAKNVLKVIANVGLDIGLDILKQHLDGKDDKKKDPDKKKKDDSNPLEDLIRKKLKP